MKPILNSRTIWAFTLLVFFPFPTLRAQAHRIASEGKIAYVEQGNIWVTHADGRGKRRLTASGRDTSPAWSRDGTKLVFVRQAEKGSESGAIYSIHTGSGGEHLLVEGDTLCPAHIPAKAIYRY